MRQVHRLALGQLGAQVVQQQLGRHALVQTGDRDARADPAHADDADPHGREEYRNRRAGAAAGQPMGKPRPRIR